MKIRNEELRFLGDNIISLKGYAKRNMIISELIYSPMVFSFSPRFNGLSTGEIYEKYKK